jgi:hypothetical protein
MNVLKNHNNNIKICMNNKNKYLKIYNNKYKLIIFKDT